jgi:hypothetical protein
MTKKAVNMKVKARRLPGSTSVKTLMEITFLVETLLQIEVYYPSLEESGKLREQYNIYYCESGTHCRSIEVQQGRALYWLAQVCAL